MTRVLNERYGFTFRGMVAFALNRMLRLWPAYMVITLLALVAVRFLPLANFFFRNYPGCAGRFSESELVDLAGHRNRSSIQGFDEC
jgi:peptidoglycan/LPS O-acetylase OafA/YrhL